MAKSEVLPLCDSRGNQLRDQHGPIGYSDSEVRSMVARGIVSVRRTRDGKTRYLVVRDGHAFVKHHGANKASMLTGAPYVIRVQVGDHHVYKHVAHRCNAAAIKPGHIDSPVSASNL